MKVLFICAGNSCRSQMAEAFTNNLKKDEIEAYSAGIDPRCLDPFAIKVMKEVGIDITDQKTKHINDVKDIEFDHAIIVCNYVNKYPPMLKKCTNIIYHEFDDPPFLVRRARTTDEILFHYRRVRDEVRDFVMGFPDSLKKAN